MKFNTANIAAFLVCAVVFGYLLLPNPDFPAPLPDSLQSRELADTETPLRRAYFTNLSREEVMGWYKSQYSVSLFGRIPLPTYRLNYPPEESQRIIRDQTRSTFLEEIVHPFRESLYINGFEPDPGDEKNSINIEGKHWRQKIIVRHVPSGVRERLGAFALTIIVMTFLFREYKKILKP